MSKADETLYRLYRPFSQVYERKGGGGKTFKYVKARQVMNRLTEVLGPTNWSDEYEVHGDTVICKLTVRVRDEDGSWISITRSDTGEAGQGEDLDGDKSIFSDAFKRAAVKFGCASYLYNEGVPEKAMAYFENGHRELAMPTKVDAPNGYAAAPRAQAQGEWATNYKCPRHGKALFAWTKDLEKKFRVEAMNQMLADPEVRGIFPKFMGDWTEDQVQVGYLKLVDLWKKAGVWPDSDSPEPRPEPAATRVSTTSIQPPPAPEIVNIKQGVRNKVVELICKEEGVGPEDVKYNMFLDRINKIGRDLDIYIDNWAPYRDKEKLLELGNAVMEALNDSAPDIPF